MDEFVNKVFRGHCLSLLRRMPDNAVDTIIADPMYMVARKKSKSCIYEWGPEPGSGTAEEFWEYHQPIYQECRRVLKPGGAFAWAVGCKFKSHFSEWYGQHRIWGFSRYFYRGTNAFGHIWVVQTKEQSPIAFPDDDALLMLGPRPSITLLHPCAKTEEEMLFMVRHLTNPGQIVLDCFAAPAPLW